MPRDWDADAYDRLPIPMTRWGTEVVGWLELTGDERVLDAGCGTGQVTRELLRRLPNGTVVALDGSTSMIEQARRRLDDDRVEFVVHDLLDPLPIAPVDAILSTATFHWVTDHERLFANLAGVLRHGGQLAAQYGGPGTRSGSRTSFAISATTSRKTSCSRGRTRLGAGWSVPGSIGSSAGCTTSRRRSLRTIWSCISERSVWGRSWNGSRQKNGVTSCGGRPSASPTARSEEHTSELQSQSNLVCR